MSEAIAFCAGVGAGLFLAGYIWLHSRGYRLGDGIFGIVRSDAHGIETVAEAQARAFAERWREQADLYARECEQGRAAKDRRGAMGSYGSTDLEG